jgi:putative peptide maturation system protein
MILIVAAPDDDHVAAVEPELRRRGASVLRLDLAELPDRAQLSVAYEPGARARPLLRLRDTEIDLRTVTAVWSLRPSPPSPSPDLSAEARDYARKETADTWTGITALLDCPWLPGPRWQELRAEHKPLQLQVASELGFEIPPTLITNSPDDFLDFHRRHNGAVVTKTVHNRLLPVDRAEGYTAYVLTEAVANRDLGYADAIRHCPVTVQPYVDKRVELRVTVVGERVFPVAMQSQWTNHTRRDWRRGDHHHGRYAVHDLPAAVAERCVELVRRLGLRFGALDLILTPDGRYVFLEINPNGAWLWMQRTTGLPIGAAIADVLMAGATASPAAVTPGPSSVASIPQSTPPAAPPLIPPAARLASARIPRAVETALATTLRYLVKLGQTGTLPTEAAAGLRRLAGRRPGVDTALTWEVESGSGAIHYDALLRLAGAGTVSLAWSPDRRVPWALRHAHHARESDLLRVNGRTLNMQTVMGYLDALWYDADLLASLVDGCLVREAVDAHGIEASDAEVRRAIGAFRTAHGLASVATRDAWLRQRGWTADDLDHEIRRQVIAAKLRRHIAGGRVGAYFTRHRRQLDAATLARVRGADRDAAHHLARRLRRSPVTMAQALEEAIVAGETASTSSEVETVRRGDLASRDARAIFAASPGAVVGPIAAVEGWDVVRVLRVTRARLDTPTRELITGILFDEWLAARRAEATLEWFWGDAERAPSRPGRPGSAR